MNSAGGRMRGETIEFHPSDLFSSIDLQAIDTLDPRSDDYVVIESDG